MGRKWGFKVHRIIKATASEISRAIIKVGNKATDISCTWDQTCTWNFKALNQQCCFLWQYFPQKLNKNNYAFTKRAAWGNLKYRKQYHCFSNQNISMWFWKHLLHSFLFWIINNHLVLNIHFSTLIVLSQQYLRKNFVSSLKKNRAKKESQKRH